MRITLSMAFCYLTALAILFAAHGWAEEQAAGLLVLITSAAIIYPLKLLIVRNTTRKPVAIALFLGMLALCMAYIQQCIEAFDSADERFPLSPVVRWVGIPIGLLLVPTISFLADLVGQKEPTTLLNYSVRSIVEVLVVIPIWWTVWVVMQILLGWVWVY